jgi:molybdenum cofactor synthesis domain-containing protein
MVLCHDVTEIVPGKFKGPAFKKGHVILKQDVSKLLDIGKENIAVLDLEPGWIHENDAAQRIAIAASGSCIQLSEPSEGKVSMIAIDDGVLKIDIGKLDTINTIPDIMMATLHTNNMVKRGQTVAGTRIIPMIIENSSLNIAEAVCDREYPIVSVKPLLENQVGIITTGSEVYNNRIKDKFGPVVKEKISSLGCKTLRQIYVPDDIVMTSEAILTLIQEGADIVMLTGGMSVDPDDRTPSSIRATGAEVITYGAPVLPGAMFMLAYLGDIPIIGLPGCVMYHKATIFDLVLPRILAGERLTRKDFTTLGHGAMCAGCDVCRYPECGFGK